MMKMRTISTLLLIFTYVSIYASVWPLMPQGNGHQISHYYGDYEWDEFHPEFDLPASAGTSVYTPITGVVRYVMRNDNNNPDAVDSNRIDICTSVSDTNHFWVLGHIYGIDTTYKSALEYASIFPESVTVVPNTDFYCGKICNWPFNPSGGVVPHLGLAYYDVDYAGTYTQHFIPSNPFVKGLLPLPSMIPVVDSIIIRKDNSHSIDDNIQGSIIWGDIDIIAFAYTNIEGNINSGVNEIGYKVTDSTGNVIISEIPLVNFKYIAYNYFFNINKTNLLYDDAYRNSNNRYIAQGNPYIVTNRYNGGCIGGLGNVAERCWATKAKNSTSGINANEDKAIFNSEAKYPDGEYRVWVLAYDIKGNGYVDKYDEK